jgi:hypothetical protein
MGNFGRAPFLITGAIIFPGLSLPFDAKHKESMIKLKKIARMTNNKSNIRLLHPHRSITFPPFW